MLEKEVFKEFHGKTGGLVSWNKPRNFLKIAKLNIFIPFADAFEYKGDGILLIGCSDSGKTSLTGRFARYNNRYSKRLAEDTSTNWFDGEKTFVYPTKRSIYIDLKPVMECRDKYPILAIFHLKNKKSKSIKKGNLEQALQQMFSRLGFNKSRLNKKIFDHSYEAYRRIPILTLPYDETPDKRYHKLKEAIVSLRKKR